MTERKETCRGCHFWVAVNESELGECRRFTPMILTVDLREEDLLPRGSNDGFARQIESVTRFPVTYAGDWCGDGEWELDTAEESGGTENVFSLRPVA